jgi:hypothetical protein
VSLVGLYLLAAILCAIPIIDDTLEVKFDRPNLSIVADCGNGLTAAQRVSFHHVLHGYEITPRPASGGHPPIARHPATQAMRQKRTKEQRAGSASSDRPRKKLRTRQLDPKRNTRRKQLNGANRCKGSFFIPTATPPRLPQT